MLSPSGHPWTDAQDVVQPSPSALSDQFHHTSYLPGRRLISPISSSSDDWLPRDRVLIESDFTPATHSLLPCRMTEDLVYQQSGYGHPDQGWRSPQVQSGSVSFKFSSEHTCLPTEKPPPPAIPFKSRSATST